MRQATSTYADRYRVILVHDRYHPHGQQLLERVHGIQVPGPLHYKKKNNNKKKRRRIS
jgi:hypothetical protein